MAKNKNLISDEELLRAAKDCRSSFAFDELLRRYTYYSKALTSSITYNESHTGIRKEELDQVALISFYKAFKKIKRGTKSFYLYWEKAARRDIRLYFQENSYLEGGSMFAGLSFDELTFDNNDHFTLSDTVGESDERITKDILIHDLIAAINGKVKSLSETEKQIILLFLNGYSMPDIAKKLHIHLSSVYNHFNKATEKLRSFIEKM